ncbi:MAG TPA: hypothetical protein VIQ30_26940 [Pseudonocardia sp.]
MTDEPGELVTSGLEPRGVFGIYNDLVCAVLGVLLDVSMVLAVIHYWDNGIIPIWLDAHGHWYWLGAGALAGMFLSALAEAVLQLDYEAQRVGDHRLRMRIAEALRSDAGERR